MKRIVTKVIERCSECPYHEVSGRMGIYSEWCTNPVLEGSNGFKGAYEIHGKALKRAFPTWCPLNTLVTVTKSRGECTYLA